VIQQKQVNETITNAWLRGHIVGLTGLAASVILFLKFSWDGFLYIGPAFYIAIVTWIIIKKGRELDKANLANKKE